METAGQAGPTGLRDHDLRHMIGSLDRATGRRHYRIRDQKRSGDHQSHAEQDAAIGDYIR